MPVSPRATALLAAARAPRPSPAHPDTAAGDPAPTEAIPVIEPAPARRTVPGRPAGDLPADGADRPDAPHRDRGRGTDPREGRTRPEVDELPSRRLVRGSDGVLEIPSGLVGGRVAPPWLAVGGAAVVVLVAVAAVLFSVFGRGTTEEPVATRPTPGATRFTAPGSTGAPADVGSTGPDTQATTPAVRGPVTVPVGSAAIPSTAGHVTTPAQELLVHVVGEVRKPGVVGVPAGARVKDAIEKAGGPTRKAVLGVVNLARPVVDGEQILVPDSADAPIPVNTLPPPSPAAGPGRPAPGGAPVDLNSADQAALEQLPGVGPVMAARIIEWRTAHGRFTSVDELGEVRGIGDKTLESLRPHVTI